MVGEWYALKEKEGWQCNLGTTSSLLLTRLLVHDPEVKVDGPLDMASSAAAINASAKDGKIYKNTIKSRTPSNKEKARP